MTFDYKQKFNSVVQSVKTARLNSNRPLDPVRIVAVSKKQGLEAIKQLYALGQRDFAESYLQEALPKIIALRELDIIWHFIGRIQGNKTGDIARNFDWVHSVDREKVACRLSEQRPGHLPDLNVCIQINISQEANKSGTSLQYLPDLAKRIQGLDRLTLRGLMAIPAANTVQLDRDNSYVRMRQIYDTLRQSDFHLDTLSMGMSADLELAIMEGASCIRIGTAFFGDRG